MRLKILILNPHLRPRSGLCLSHACDRSACHRHRKWIAGKIYLLCSKKCCRIFNIFRFFHLGWLLRLRSVHTRGLSTPSEDHQPFFDASIGSLRSPPPINLAIDRWRNKWSDPRQKFFFERREIISLKHVSCHLNLFKKNRSLALLTFHLDSLYWKNKNDEKKWKKYSSYLWECQKNANEKRNPIHFRRRRRQTKRRRWLLKDSCSLELLFFIISLLLFAAWWPQIKRTIE